MLGPIKTAPSWSWGAYGKHPIARDFFRVGEDFPLIRSFSGWVEDGYNKLTPRGKNDLSHNSWRFWAKGQAKDTLVCGLIRDSGDSVGRHYPLLIMGTGSLKGWEEQWDLIPFACEKTWGQIEYISAQSFNDLKKLETEIQNIRPPFSEWQELRSKREQGPFPGNPGELKITEMLKQGNAESFVPLDQNAHHDHNALISYCHFFIKSSAKAAPNAVFMGGTFGRAFLVFYKRPLMPADFEKLWTA